MDFKNSWVLKLRYFLWTLISTPLINGALISATLISIISVRNSWYTFDILDVCLRNRSILARWRSTSNNETVKNPRSGQISLVDPLHTLRESTTKKFPFWIICLSLFLLSQQVLFLCDCRIKVIPSLWNVTLLFCINFLYLKVTCH